MASFNRCFSISSLFWNRWANSLVGGKDRRSLTRKEGLSEPLCLSINQKAQRKGREDQKNRRNGIHSKRSKHMWNGPRDFCFHGLATLVWDFICTYSHPTICWLWQVMMDGKVEQPGRRSAAALLVAWRQGLSFSSSHTWRFERPFNVCFQYTFSKIHLTNINKTGWKILKNSLATCTAWLYWGNDRNSQDSNSQCRTFSTMAEQNSWYDNIKFNSNSATAVW